MGHMTQAAMQYAPHRNGAAPTPPVLRIGGLSKTFGATRALLDVSLDIRAGEIHALVGQNGSGKSTLIKTLAGYHTPDPGSRRRARRRAVRARARRCPTGCASSTRTSASCSSSARMDNLALHGGFAAGAAAACAGASRSRRPHRVLARFGVDLDIHRPLAAATPVERTVVAIAAALQGWHGGRGVLVLDEPTAVLPHDEVERLFAIVREVRERGHERPLRLAPARRDLRARRPRDRPARRPRDRARTPSPTIDPRGLASLMVGEDVDPDYRAPVAARPDAPVVLEARDVAGRWLRGVDLDVHAGEILGIAGLAGAGVLELPYVIAGCAPRRRSPARIRLPERSDEWRDVADARDLDIPLVPADREREGVIAEFAVSENLSLSILGRLGRRGTARQAREARARRASGRSASAIVDRRPRARRSRRSAAATSRRSSWRAAWRASPACSCSASRPRASTSAPAWRSTT